MSSGCIREAIYQSPVWGRTITELREIKAPAYIRWSTLMQEGTLFQFVPKADDNPKIQSAHARTRRPHDERARACAALAARVRDAVIAARSLGLFHACLTRAATCPVPRLQSL